MRTDRELILTATLRDVGRSIDAYLARLQGGEAVTPLGSVFLMLSAVREDIDPALPEPSL